MTEAERIVAVPKLMDWSASDETVKTIVKAVLAATNQPAIGHLARFEPFVFDELFEEAEAITTNDL